MENEITIKDLTKAIENGKLINLLRERLSEFDWTYFEAAFEQERYFTDTIQRVATVFKDREDAKLGICNSGVCLLLDYCIELLQYQQTYGVVDPSKDVPRFKA